MVVACASSQYVRKAFDESCIGFTDVTILATDLKDENSSEEEYRT